MKNLIIALSFFFALGVNAQTKKSTKAPVTTEVAREKINNELAAAKNVTDLSAFVTLDSQKQAMMQELFTTKFRMIEKDFSSENRKEVARIITGKLEASLDSDTFEKIKANTKLFQSLVN